MLSRQQSLEVEVFSPPHKDVKVEPHHLVWRSRLLKFRKKVIVLCRQLFPSLPLPSKDCAQISHLIDQIIRAVEDKEQPAVQALPLKCCGYEPKVLLCSSPKACLKHLRRKTVRLINALLPELSLGKEVQGHMVDELLHRVFSANKQQSSSPPDIT
jgi:hypothetical protein